MKIYFVRHGETDMNARNMFYGWYDADINEKGIAQAEELRAAFETIHIDAIYSSDLKRAYHTAEIIVNGREIQPFPKFGSYITVIGKTAHGRKCPKRI